MTQEEIKQVLELHAAWLGNREGGKRANLSGADLYRANLYRANLSGANLSGANLYRANLSGANLYRADLYRANLYGADLSRAENAALVWAQTEILPREGQIVGWKKCRNKVVVKLLVGKTARRSNSTGRKCRAERVKVLEVIGSDVGISMHDCRTEYRLGKIVECDAWNEDRWTECGGGIHFFLTREEAEAYTG